MTRLYVCITSSHTSVYGSLAGCKAVINYPQLICSASGLCTPTADLTRRLRDRLWQVCGDLQEVTPPKIFLINMIASCAPLLHLLWETVYVYVYTKEAPPAVCPINPVNKSGEGGGARRGTDFCPLGARRRRKGKFGFNHRGRAGLGTAPAGTQAL